jgi:signal transduction histidine kinase
LSTAAHIHLISKNPSAHEGDRDYNRLQSLVARVTAIHRTDPAKAMKPLREGLELAARLEDKVSRFELMLCFGRIEARKGQLNRADSLLREALSLLPGRKAKKESLCQVYLALGAVAYLQHKNQLALEYYSQALSYNVNKYKKNLFLNIANLYFTNANYRKSMQYQRKALKLALQENDIEHQIFCSSNIGAILVKLDQLAKARTAFEDVLRMINVYQGSDYQRCRCLINLGDVHGRLGNRAGAEDFYRQAIRIARTNQFEQELAMSYQYLGALHSEDKDDRTLLYFLYRSRQLARKKGFENILTEVLRLLQSHFEKKGDFKKAYQYLGELADAQCQFKNSKQQKELGQLLESKDKEISILERQRNQIEHQKQKLERYNRDLEQSNRDLEQSNRDLEQYAFVVAHDLKEPLRNISSFTSLIQQRYGGQLDETAQEYMGFVVRNAGRMNSLLTELLRYTTLKRHHSRAPEEVNTELVVRQVIHDLDERVQATGAVFYLSDLPSAGVVHEHLYQLFFSLIDNALQFKANKRPEVHIQGFRKEQYLEFRVQDNGIGIEAPYREKIFKLFQRLDKERYNGTGIGLALCKKIVQLYDGEISLESEPGVGSTFSFTLRDGI